MKNQSKIRLVALAMAACASLTACGNTADDNMDTVQYTEGKQQEQTTRYNSIYDSMDDYPQNEEQQATEATAETEAVETVMVNEFDKVSDFNEGHAIVRYNGINYLIDTNGNKVLEFIEEPKNYIIYDGGFIVLENGNIMNLDGEIIVDKSTIEYDIIKGIYNNYIILVKEVDTLERTGFDFCILNSDGSVKLDWTPEPDNPNMSSRNILTEKSENFIQLETGTFGDYKAIYNLENGLLYCTHNWNEDNNEWVVANETINRGCNWRGDACYVEFYDYGYGIIFENKNEFGAEIYDYNENLIDTFTSETMGARFSEIDAFDEDIMWASYLPEATNTFYDFRLRTTITLPYNIDNINYVDITRCGKNKNFYLIELRNKEGSTFFAVANENGNYVVEPTKDKILTYNDGVYTTYGKMCKADGTIIYEGSFGQFIDGYCRKDEWSFVDINGNKLEVEFKTE